MLPNPPLDKKNPHFGNNYASLEGIIEHLNKHGVLDNITQGCQVRDGHLLFVTSDGEREVAFPFDPGKAGPQAVGSALTYARRYGLLLFFNLVGEPDDDAERAEGRGGNKPARKKTTKKPAPKPEADTEEDW